MENSSDEPQDKAESVGYNLPWPLQVAFLAAMMTAIGAYAKWQGDKDVESLKKIFPPAQKAPLEPGAQKKE